jgi:hypothetical protein
MLLLKWSKIVWSKRNRYFLGTIQQIAPTFSITSSFFNVFSKEKDKYSDFKYIDILYSQLPKAIRFLPVNFLFDDKTLIVLLESLFSSHSVNFNWNDCNWEFKISIYLKSGYLSFALELVINNKILAYKSLKATT